MDGWMREEPLAAHTTFQIGGPAEFFAVARTVAELRDRIRDADTHAYPVTFLGGGSNVLVSDEGIRGAVIKIAIDGITEAAEGDAVRVTAGAGVTFDELVAYTVERGYWGLENLSAIPGTVGATPVQNVGAYGVEVADVIEFVTVLDTTSLEARTLTNNVCAFGYRDSAFKRGDLGQLVVTEVTFLLSTTPVRKLSYRDLATRFEGSAEPSQAAIREAVTSIRAKKFPNWHKVGTAGSFFKNPIITETAYQTLRVKYPELPSFPAGEGMVKIPLGWILDKVIGVRGLREGNVGAYEGQALVLVNYGDANAREVAAFAETIAARVHEATGITIEWEVTKIG
jgi:UDP-N-acetylmuramate dehydrogenase